jgi:hypothetical protein
VRCQWEPELIWRPRAIRKSTNAEFARERDAVEYLEAEAREVLALTYQIRGLPADEANCFVDDLAHDK